jgi:hypothetical protein
VAGEIFLILLFHVYREPHCVKNMTLFGEYEEFACTNTWSSDTYADQTRAAFILSVCHIVPTPGHENYKKPAWGWRRCSEILRMVLFSPPTINISLGFWNRHIGSLIAVRYWRTADYASLVLQRFWILRERHPALGDSVGYISEYIIVLCKYI